MTAPRTAWIAAAFCLVGAGCSDSKGGDTAGTDGEAASSYTLTPPEGGLGQSLRVLIQADRSAFTYGATEVDFGEGVAVNAVTVDDGWTAVADITIEPDAEEGERLVSLVSDGRTLTEDLPFRVRSDSFTISPDNGKMGETLEVQLVGNNTQWEAGRTWLDLGDDVEVTSLTVLSETIIEATVAISADADPGWRDIWTEDGSHVVTLYDGFLVDRVALAAEWDPGSVVQGQTVEFSVFGRDTNFIDGQTEIRFFDGSYEMDDIVVDSVTVLDAENLWGRATVSNAAEIGYRDVLVTTGEEGVTIPDAFMVEAGAVSLDEVAVSLVFNVVRGVDNSTGNVNQSVNASCIFYIPLDPACPQSAEAAACSDGVDNDYDGYTDCYDTDCERDLACAASGPQPYDSTVVTESLITGGDPHDCPVPTTVSAGDYVWLESEANVVTLTQNIDSSTGMIYYAPETPLTMDDYVTGQWYDLHLQGDPDGLPEEIIERVQPTVPADWELLTPALWNNYTHDRDEYFYFTWTPAQTYPDAIFAASIGGVIEATGNPGSVANIPWDDGAHYFEPYLTDSAGVQYPYLQALGATDVTFSAYSYIEGVKFGLKDSIYQTNETESYIYLSASMILE
jgi:hypothetical protein